jgi:hypothetical protein
MLKRVNRVEAKIPSVCEPLLLMGGITLRISKPPSAITCYISLRDKAVLDLVSHSSDRSNDPAVPNMALQARGSPYPIVSR